MDLKVLAQPYRESVASGQTFVTTALGDGGVNQLLVVTAWVRQSGIELLVPGLEILRKRRGKSRILFGVDLQGTTRQGVDLARKHFTDVYVVHDPSGRTFHPKMYLAHGKRVGYALIGSNNLTAGGLWHNYETSAVLTFDPRHESEAVEGIQSYAQRLLSDTAICKRVTQSVYDRLIAENWLADEEEIAGAAMRIVLKRVLVGNPELASHHSLQPARSRSEVDPLRYEQHRLHDEWLDAPGAG